MTDLKFRRMEKSPVEIEMEHHWRKIEEIEIALQSADETDAARLEQQLSYHQSKLTELEGRLNRC